MLLNVFGVFALKNGVIIEKILFERDPAVIAGKMFEAENENKVLSEEYSMIKKLNVRELEVDNPERFSRNLNFTDINFREFRKGGFINLENIANQIGIDKDTLLNLLFEVNLELTKIKMRVPERDQMAIQSIKAINEIDDIINRLVESLREWYSIHFPEADSMIKNHEIYAMIARNGHRKNLSNKNSLNLNTLNFSDELYKNLVEASKSSFGADFSDSDLSGIVEISNQILNMYRTRKILENYTEKIMKEIMPNSTALAGAILSARILAIAGSMKRLAEMPASTIQMLGAETALFRFLKTKNKPPKHGVIFTLPEIANSKKSVRGRLARTFASKFSIAVKVDVYKGEFIGEKLREEFLDRVKKQNT